MRHFRRISLAVHGALELTMGLLLVVAAFLLDLGDVGTVATFAGGAALAGIGLDSAERMPLAVHESLDRWLVVSLAGAGVLAAADGGALAATLLLAAAAAELTVASATRWTRPARRPRSARAA